MAGNPGFKSGSVLGATAFPVDLDALGGKLCHASFALINDHASAILSVKVDDQPAITLKAGEQLQVTGTDNSKSLSLTSDTNPTAFRLMCSPSPVAPKFHAPGGATVVTANLADGSVTESKIVAAGTADTANVVREGVAVYDFAVGGGTVGAIAIGVALPNKAVITKAWMQQLTNFTSGGFATVKLGTQQASDSGTLKAATAFDDNAFKTTDQQGWHDLLPDGTAANFTKKQTAATNKIILTVATADLTAGKLAVHYQYEVGL